MVDRCVARVVQLAVSDLGLTELAQQKFVHFERHCAIAWLLSVTSRWITSGDRGPSRQFLSRGTFLVDNFGGLSQCVVLDSVCFWERVPIHDRLSGAVPLLRVLLFKAV